MIAEGKLTLPTIEVGRVDSLLTSFHIKLNGGFLFDFKDNISLKIRRIIEESSIKYPNKQILLDYIHEPIVFLNRDHLEKKKSISWFEFLHDTCNALEFDVSNIILLTSNVYGEETYRDWCEENLITNRMTVKSQHKSFWLSKLIKRGYTRTFNNADKKLSLFIGRPNFQKSIIVKWYLEKIVNTDLESDVVSTFLFDGFTAPEEWGILKNKIDQLPGAVETGKQSHPALTLPWGGKSLQFSEHFSRGIINFTVDYLENENFSNYEDYIAFKNTHKWWKEDMISEKTFKCIVLKRPFIRLGMPHSLKKLKEWGFKTFDGVLFDESYDDMNNFYDRLNNILTQVEHWLNTPLDELKQKVNAPEVQAILDHNYNLAYELYNNKEELVNV